MTKDIDRKDILQSRDGVGGSGSVAGAVARGPTESGHGWRPIDEPPSEPVAVMMYCPMARHETLLAGQDYSIEVGFWDRGFREQGTGHEMNERLAAWGGDGNTPTHWMPLPAPPALSGV